MFNMLLSFFLYAAVKCIYMIIIINIIIIIIMLTAAQLNMDIITDSTVHTSANLLKIVCCVCVLVIGSTGVA